MKVHEHTGTVIPGFQGEELLRLGLTLSGAVGGSLSLTIASGEKALFTLRDPELSDKQSSKPLLEFPFQAFDGAVFQASGILRLEPRDGSELAPVTHEALRPLVRQVAQTLSLCLARSRAPTNVAPAPGPAHASGIAQSQFQLLFESAPGMYLVLEPQDYRIVAVSNAYLNATGTCREQILGRRLFDVFPDDPADPRADGVEALSASLDRVKRHRTVDVMAIQRYPIRVPAADGGRFVERYWSPINTPVTGPDGSVAFIIHRVEDITDYVRARRDGELVALPEADVFSQAQMEAEIVLRSSELKRMAEALRESDRRSREQAELLDHATDAIMVRSMDNRILYWNKAAEIRYGWKSEEVLSRSITEVIYRKDDPAFEAAMRALERYGDFTGRMVHVCRDGRQLVVDARWVLVRNEDGTPRAILSIVTDLTERVSLEAQLLQAQKLEVLGQLTGGISHDFNNLLAVILGNAEVLEDIGWRDTAVLDLARTIRLAAEKGASLTRRLLAFARRQPLDPEVIEVCDVVEEMRPLLQRTLGEQISTGIRCDTQSALAFADPGQLEAAILNLCINARDAMPGGGHVLLEIGLTCAPEAALGLPEGEYVWISVCDSGHGMNPDVMERAFEPFFTTKESAQGSGLGLSMVYGFVKQSRGEVKIHSVQGRGTTVTLYLPRVTAAGAA